MKKIVEILKSLHKEGKLSIEQLRERVAKGTITEAEFKEITGENYQ